MKLRLFAAAMVMTCGFGFNAWAAGPSRGDLGLNLAIGQDIPINGDMHGVIDNTYPDIGPLFPPLSGQSGRAIIDSRSFDDFYGATTLYALTLSYAYTDNLEFFLQGTHTEGDSDLVQIGTLASPAAGAPSPLYARFSSYRASTLELGMRGWLGEPDNRLRPFAALHGGVARTDAISATFSAPALGSGDSTLPFYGETTSWVAGADFGVAYEVLRTQRARVELAASVGARFIGRLDENDDVLSTLGAAGLNDKSRRTSMPVQLSLTVRY
jgi:hypothetical protein